MKSKLRMLFSAIALVFIFCIPVSARSATVNGNNVTQLTPSQNQQTMKYTINRPNDYIGKSDSQYIYGMVLPIKVTTPGLLSAGLTSNGTEYVQAVLCSDQDCSTVYAYGNSYLSVAANKASGKKSSGVYISKAGTYYLLLVNVANGYQNASFSGEFTYRFTSSADRGLSANKVVKSSVNPNGTYYKISVPSNGYITLQGYQKNKYILGTKLYNSKKKAISNTDGVLQSANGYANTYKVNKGTYYIYIEGNAFFEYDLKYTFKTAISASDNKAITVTPANLKQDIYVKIKAKKTGYITVTDYSNAAYITLCNKKQKQISDQAYVSASNKNYKTATFAVKKNQTYYLKVNSYTAVKMKYAVKAVSDQSGSSAGKAKAIKKGKTVEGLILPEENKADYYKVTLTKAQALKLTVKAKSSSGAYNIEVYSNKKCTKKYRLGGSTLNYYNTKLTLTSTSNIGNKLSKGTYYIKVTRKNSKSNGYYSIKWN